MIYQCRLLDDVRQTYQMLEISASRIVTKSVEFKKKQGFVQAKKKGMISAISSKGSTTSSGLPWFVGPPTRSLHCRFAGTHSISFVNIHRMIYLVSVALLRNLHSVPK